MDLVCEISKRDYKREEKAYIAFVSALHRSERKRLNESIEKICSEIESLTHVIEALKRMVKTDGERTRLGEAQTSIVQLKTKKKNLEDLKRFATVNEGDLQIQFRRFWEVPRVSSIWLDVDRLCYETLPLFGRHHSTCWHRIGPMHISFRLTNPDIETFRWTNLEGAKGGQHAPPNIRETTVTGEGECPCPGTEGFAVLEEAKRTNNYLALVAFSVRYAECPGDEENDSIKKWPRVNQRDVPRWYIDQFE